MMHSSGPERRYMADQADNGRRGGEEEKDDEGKDEGQDADIII